MSGAPKVFQFKLVLLGDSAVGKSSLVLRFVRGQFFEYQESTIGGAMPKAFVQTEHELGRADQSGQRAGCGGRGRGHACSRPRARRAAPPRACAAPAALWL